MSILLEATGLEVSGRLVECSIRLNAGELTMLVGPNGSGKTTLLHALAGIGEGNGNIEIGGENPALVSAVRRTDLLSFMGASRDTKWPLTAKDYVALALPGRANDAQIDVLFRSLNIEEFLNRRIDQLSTGERSRIILARTLVAGSRAILLDEPCANLDPEWQLAVIERLKTELGRGSTILMSVHDLDLALHHADRVIVMRDGEIVADGVPDTALNPEMIARVFGVQKDNSARWTRV